MVSVILPIYNVEKFLRKCLESLQAQSLPDIEFILVDDGSPDNSGAICDEFAEKDTRFKVIHQPNRGVSAARNAGLECAKGDFIGFVDPDDFVLPSMYELLLSSMVKSVADIAAIGYNYYDENYKVDETRLYVCKPLEVMSREVIYSRLSDMPPTFRHVVWSKLFKRDLIGDLRFDESKKSGEDLDFLMNYLSRVQKGVFVHEPLYCNLVREGSATHGGLKIKSLHDSFPIHERMYLDTVREFPYLKYHAIAYLLDVLTLKYNDAKRQLQNSPSPSEESTALLKSMHRTIRRYALRAFFAPTIYWKTRLSYLLR